MDFLRRSLDYALTGSFKRKVLHNIASLIFVCISQTGPGFFCCWGIICCRVLDGDIYGAHRVLQNCNQKGGKFATMNLFWLFSCVTKHMTPCTSQEAERRDEAFVCTLICLPISHLHALRIIIRFLHPGFSSFLCFSQTPSVIISRLFVTTITGSGSPRSRTLTPMEPRASNSPSRNRFLCCFCFLSELPKLN